MATDGGRSAEEHDERVRNELLTHGCSYDFYYTVGMLERLFPDAVRVGGPGPYDGEMIRFRHDPALTFKPGDITKLTYEEKPRAPENLLDEARHRFEVTTAFLGLTGSVSPMPLYIAEEIAQAQDAAPVQRDFLDMFHHRLISFVYRIGVKYDLALEYRNDASDAWSRRVLALAGFDAYEGRKAKFLAMWKLLRLSPVLASRVRSARSIELAIEGACEEALDLARVTVRQFVGGWSKLDEDQRMKLGVRNHALGGSTVLGVECFHKAGKARVQIGPLGDNFRRFLTDGDMYPVIIELIGMMTPEPIDFELELVLEDRARPPFKLGVHKGGRIGVDTWIGSGKGATKQSRLMLDLPNALPKDLSVFSTPWHSKPQRRRRVSTAKP